MAVTDDDDALEVVPIDDAKGKRVRVAIAVGLGLWFAALFGDMWLAAASMNKSAAGVRVVQPASAVAVTIAIALWTFSPTSRAISLVLDRIRRPSPSARRIATVAIAATSAIAFHVIALIQGRCLVPFWQDSNMHLVQAQLIAHGRLWTTPHPLADQMETFFVFVRPVYAALHFPGTSLLYAPLMLLGVGPAAYMSSVAGAIVGLSYRVIAEIVDGVAGALAVPVLLGLVQLRLVSITLLSHPVVVLPAMLAIWAFLRWRRAPGGRLRWAAAIGGFLGFAAITRPVEALAYAGAIGLAMVPVLRGQRWTRWLASGSIIVLAASPFIALQLDFDYHVSDGHWLRPPYEQYNRVFHPGLSYGSTTASFAGDAIPTRLPQKVDYYNSFVVPPAQRYAERGPIGAFIHERLPLVAATLAPSPFAFVFWVPALLGLITSARRILPLAVVAYLALCAPYPIFLYHYSVAFAPFAALMIGLGVHVIGRTFAGGKRSAEALATLIALALSLVAIPGVNPWFHDADYGAAQANIYVNTRLPADVAQPAILLSRYRTWDQPYDPRQDNPQDEPVYTIDALWPEDSPIARFHDLGPARNREIYQFFVDRHQSRTVYVLDRRAGRLVKIGNVDDLLKHGEPPAYFATGEAVQSGGPQ